MTLENRELWWQLIGVRRQQARQVANAFSNRAMVSIGLGAYQIATLGRGKLVARTLFQNNKAAYAIGTSGTLIGREAYRHTPITSHAHG